MSAIHEAAVDYLDRLGWQVVKVETRGKKPMEKDWPNKDPAPENFGATSNIGVKLGPKSGNLIDIDLDWAESRQMAALPELFGALPSFGREGLPYPGHRLLVCPDLRSEDAKVYKCQPHKTAKANEGKICVMEVRAASNCMTVFPPSEHEAKIVWCNGQAPEAIPQMEWAEVQRRAWLCAFLAVALRNYPGEGGRDDYVVHVAGALAHGKLDVELGEALLRGLCEAAGDTDELSMRVAKCRTAWKRVDANEETTGLQRLLDQEYFTKDEGKALGLFLRARVKSDKVSPDSIDVGDPNQFNIFKTLQARIFGANPNLIFRHCGDLVRIRTLGSDEPVREGVKARAGTTEISRINEGWVGLAATSVGVRFHKVNAEGHLRACQPQQCGLLGLWPEESCFRHLSAIALTPTMDRNEPGYDPTTNLFLAFPEGYFPEAPMRPTKADAESALARLKSPLREFPFDGEGSRAVVLSAMLSGIIRREIRTCPLHGFSAPEPGTGKTKLTELISMVVTGAPANTITYTRDPLEMEKRLDSLFLRGGGLVTIDNVDGILGGMALEQSLTGTSKWVRILGEHRTVPADTRLLMMASGNNLEARRDMARRMITCGLDAKCENPDLRVFGFDPLDEVTRARPQLAIDCLTILRAYRAAGQPDYPAPLGSFEDWTIVRGALLWLGEGDPLVTQDAGRANDPERESRAEVLEALWDHFGSERFKVNELSDPRTPVRLQNTIARHLAKGEWSPGRASNLFRRYKGRVTGDLTLRAEVDPMAKQNAYWIERIVAADSEPVIPF